MYKVYDDKTLKKLHTVEMEILDEFVRLCDKHHLRYTLFAGSMLGAVRHKGFIPWDDDVDVAMLRDDYEKFLKIAHEELDDKYYLDCFEYNKNYHLSFAKIRKNGTIFDEESNHHMNNHKGIFVDIFPIDNVYDNVKRSHFNAVLFKAINQTVFVKNKVFKLKECRHLVLSALLMIFSHQTLMKFEKKLCLSCKNNNSKLVACYCSVYPFNKELSERKSFEETMKMEFNGKKYQVIKDYDKYLKSVYGDYLKLPPKEKRINHMPLIIDFGDDK